MSDLVYLDAERLNATDSAAFQAARPYPWINSPALLTETGYTRLVETLPDLSLFQRVFGYGRSHGQQGHDRYSLDYAPDLPIAEPWHRFVRELLGREYRLFLERMFGRGSFRLQLHWHYTPRGCSVSPHCDAKRKLGSHIFYFNTAANWESSWGGETLILDDNGRFPKKSAPAFEDFDRVIPAQAIGNYSLLFGRKGNSWHGVRELVCPEGAMRKVFVVVLDDWRLKSKVVNVLRGRLHDGYQPHRE